MSDLSTEYVFADNKGTSKFESSPFDAAEIKANHGIDTSKCVYCELKSSDRLFPLVLQHVVRNSTLKSVAPVLVSNEVSLSEQLLGQEKPSSSVAMTFGLGAGSFDFTSEDGVTHRLHAVHQRRNQIVGSNRGACTWENLVLFCESAVGKDVLKQLLSTILTEQEKTCVNEFTIFRWNVECGYWQTAGHKAARKLQSVVLPAATKEKLVHDMDSFLCKDTYDFYVEHGIPYKRSYLFYGVPGAGKTSLLQALAGKYRRNLCIMQPTHPKFTDDSLADAIKEAPARSIILLEDVDALFDKDRNGKTKELSITFSGLLNALDGIANPDGQIFILTTNFRENLDSALIRNGRVDLHFEFTHAQPEQMQQMFIQFCPADKEKAEMFCQKVVETLGDKKINMAALQHFFINKRGMPADEIIASVGCILDDLMEKELQKQAEERQNKDGKKDGEKKDDGEKKGQKKNTKTHKAAWGTGNMNVYINLPGPAQAELSSEEEE